MTTAPIRTDDSIVTLIDRIRAGDSYRDIARDEQVCHQRIFHLITGWLSRHAKPVVTFAFDHGFPIQPVYRLASAVLAQRSITDPLSPTTIAAMAEHPLVALLPTWDDHPDLPPARYLTIATIARRTGMSAATARRLLLHDHAATAITIPPLQVYPSTVLNHIRRLPRGRPPKLTTAQLDVVIARYQTGARITTLARDYHCNPKTIKRAIAKARAQHT